MTAIREVVKGGSYFSPVVAREIVEQLRTPKPASNEPFSLLSGREREVLHLIAEGLSAKEIAVDLAISTKTVDVHKMNIRTKLDLHEGPELTVYAVRWIEGQNRGAKP